MKQNTYRMMQDGGEIWRGKAYSAAEAEEKCFDSWDETPGEMERYTLQRWDSVQLTSSIKGKDWVTVYKDQCLAPA